MKNVLVVGAGIAGATVAQRLAAAGVGVHLVEREAAIGGAVRAYGCKATDVCLRCNVCTADAILRSLPQTRGLRIHTNTRVARLAPGDGKRRYRATLQPTAAAGKRASLDVDAVVVATGHAAYRPTENTSYGYGRVPNVITGLDAERQLADRNRIVRPSDGQPARRIAFVQCVGSRTEEVFRRPEDTNYCSAVCCAYALRMARQIKHQAGDAQLTVFYMDIQNFGKGFNAFYRDCQNSVRFIRSRPYELRAGANGAVLVRYAPDATAAGGAVADEEFDLVVLAVGMRPADGGRELADMLGAPMDANGFFGLKTASALPDMQKAGLFAVGSCESPKDIAGCIAQAHAVSAAILSQASAPAPRAARTDAKAAVAVVGGGLAGMQAAATLAALDHPVTLIHAGRTLGGAAAAAPEFGAHLDDDADEAARQIALDVDRLTSELHVAGGVQVHLQCRAIRIDGEAGAFDVAFRNGEPERSVRVAAVVLAPGAQASPAARKPAPEWSGMTALLDAVRAARPPRRVAVIMDLTAEQDRSVTTRVLSAAESLARRGQTEVKIFSKNMRVAAFGLERLYRRVRSAGVMVAKDTITGVRVTADGGVAVDSTDPIAGVAIRDEFDLAVLADATAGASHQAWSKAVDGLKAGPDGELQPDSVWMLPVSTNRPGIYVAGAARGNSEHRDALVDGLAAAGAVHGWLSGNDATPAGKAAEVDPDKCVLCLTCVRICPHRAIAIDNEKKAARVSDASCRRCGICASECPAEAIRLPRFTDEDVSSAIGATPRLTVFACENSAIPAAEAAAGQTGGAAVQLVRVPCAGKVDPRSVLEALGKGAERVLILGCHPESCRYLTGATRAKRRAQRLAAALGKAGVDPSRVSFGGLASVEPGRFVEYVAAKADAAATGAQA